jgi:DNA (cytosine-5)-methyltransferase 1
MRFNAVDLFCGAGGLTCGLERAGIRVLAGIDIDPDCQFAYEHNNNSKFILKGLSAVSTEEISSLYPKRGFRLLVGCAPCQPFSKYTQGRNKGRDGRWSLLTTFAELITGVRPHIVSMENVTELTRHAIYDEFIFTLKELGYHVTEHKVNCVEYGIAQTRERLVVFASQFGPIPIIPPTHKSADASCVRDVIGRLEPIAAGGRSRQDRLHCASHLSEINLKRIRSSVPGGSWSDWDDDLIAACHKKETGRTYRGVYGRMEWDRPSPTITTQFYGFGNGRFGHPDQDRGLSIREAALLQSFPRTYQFFPSHEPIRFKSAGRMIGNAVPVRLGVVVGESIIRHLEAHLA